MNPDYKRKFLTGFYEFLDPGIHGMCYFRLTNGHEFQGWISEIYEDTFQYLDSGPEAKTEPYILSIADIDTESFAYWHEGEKKWLEYRA